jgi:hypothetical protein
VNRRSRRNTGQDAFFTREPAGSGKSFLILNNDYFIDDFAVQHLGNESDAYSRHRMFASRASRFDRNDMSICFSVASAPPRHR